MEADDFTEVFGAIVTCPFCGAELELDESSSRYCSGEDVTCTECEKVFLLGDPM